MKVEVLKEVPKGVPVKEVVISTAEAPRVVHQVQRLRSAQCTLEWHRQTRKVLVSDSVHESLHYPSLLPLAIATTPLPVGSGSCCTQGVLVDRRGAQN